MPATTALSRLCSRIAAFFIARRGGGQSVCRGVKPPRIIRNVSLPHFPADFCLMAFWLAPIPQIHPSPLGLITMNLKYTLAAIVAVILCCSCATSPESRSAELSLEADARAARADMISHDPSIQTAIDKACAHAVFPSVGKGGLVVGGEFGQGVVFQNGKVIGYTSVTAGSVG